MFDYVICNCKKVSFFDVEDALNKFEASGSDKDFQGLKNSVNNL